MHKNLKFYVLQHQFAKDVQEAELAWVLGFDLSLQGKWLGKWSKSKLTWSKLSIDLWSLNKNQIQCSCMFLYIYMYIHTHTYK